MHWQKGCVYWTSHGEMLIKKHKFPQESMDHHGSMVSNSWGHLKILHFKNGFSHGNQPQKAMVWSTQRWRPLKKEAKELHRLDVKIQIQIITWRSGRWQWSTVGANWSYGNVSDGVNDVKWCQRISMVKWNKTWTERCLRDVILVILLIWV